MPGRARNENAAEAQGTTTGSLKRQADAAPTSAMMKRIKLSVASSQVKQNEDTTSSMSTSRPRRNSTKPKRYSQDSATTATDSVQSPKVTKNGRKTKKSPNIAASSRPTNTTHDSTDDHSGKPLKKTITGFNEDDMEASYSNDFLAHYVDQEDASTETPQTPMKTQQAKPTSVTAPRSSTVKETTTSHSDAAPQADGTPESIKGRRKSSKSSTVEEIFPGRPDTADVSDRPVQLDNEEIMRNKLVNAVKAVQGLMNDVPISLPFSVEDIRITPKKTSSRPGLREVSPLPEMLPASRTGTTDNEIRILIHNAINMICMASAAKARIVLASSSPNGGTLTGNEDAGMLAAIQADKTAVAALEAVAASSALNINCMAPPGRLSLVWALYMSLLQLIDPNPPRVAPQVVAQALIPVVSSRGQMAPPPVPSRPTQNGIASRANTASMPLLQGIDAYYSGNAANEVPSVEHHHHDDSATSTSKAKKRGSSGKRASQTRKLEFQTVY